ncbi:3'(2'),5'-bisphosphate nucleotidase [Pleomorphomonas diazotrophica]|uniref:3'(2'),5'-bisphosphate nucleotidase CysQ n=1 Tax=Pleomorphomonas diazotrophica TaxID=1166257 RepID=A0A1I4R1I9_9HYPH|nr:3'(2'),5'-bisphosphate nucleotidase CysQ [Pleomorphomonas diazotrophica]PKR90268.1 3'(2'),5'-bisphosphate nucleotidase [Pleomorphomonas diazotrophica]SFM46182.1 3'(2'),5'-bisphosphate nucleotidase [Pleomorphomonas diazotrophica]
MTIASPRLLDGLIAASIEAGQVILDIYARPIDVAFKADASPVTEADGLAEAVLLAALTRLAPDVPVVAEESVSAGRVPAAADRFFLVDPLDGTKEFIRRNGDFTVNVALIERGEPVMGVVHAPAIGRLFAGGPEGAWEMAVDGDAIVERRPIRVRDVPAEGATLLVSRSHATAATDAFRPTVAVADRRVVGSSLKFCLIAAGEADVYPRFGPTMEWDTAAGDAVLRAAGGIMVLPDGELFPYGKRDRPGLADFANPSFIAASDRRLVAFHRDLV